MSEITLILDTSESGVRFGLFEDDQKTAEHPWEAGRDLAKNFYRELDGFLEQKSLQYQDINNIIIVLGPGSFTGLRIGITIVNAFSYALDIKTAGVVQHEKITVEQIFEAGKNNLTSGQILIPFYGKEPNITKKQER